LDVKLMKTPRKIGIIICDRYRTCSGGKCLRALRNREGAFQRYRGEEVELVGYATCNGCPGGNVEYAPAEMKKTVQRSSILPPA
jgi:predicted metal-binding protein